MVRTTRHLTCRYEVALPILPPKGECDLCALDVMILRMEASKAGATLVHPRMVLWAVGFPSLPPKDECYLGVLDIMQSRIEALKVGGSLVHLLLFLLADVAHYEAPVIDTSRYAIAFPVLPP